MTAIQISQGRQLKRPSILRRFTATLRALDAALLERFAAGASAERLAFDAHLRQDIGIDPGGPEAGGIETGNSDAIASRGLGADDVKRWATRSPAPAEQTARGRH